jgi:hypothetical protein
MTARKRQDIARDVKDLRTQALDAGHKAQELAQLATKAESTLKGLSSGLTAELEQEVNLANQKIEEAIDREQRSADDECEQALDQLEQQKESFESAIVADHADIQELNQLSEAARNAQVNGANIQRAEQEKQNEIKFLVNLVDDIDSTQAQLQKIGDLKRKRGEYKQIYTSRDLDLNSANEKLLTDEGSYSSSDPSGSSGEGNSLPPSGGSSSGRNSLPPSGVDLEQLSHPSSTRRIHILDGDTSGGGHGSGRKIPGKSEFPWTDQQTLNYIADIVTDPNSIWSQQTGSNGSLYTRSGRPSRWNVTGHRDNIDVKIVIEPAGEGIITAFPTNIPANL